MASTITTNMASIWASKNLQNAQSKMADSVERLSSGLRINRARDDASGLGVSSLLTQQINGANQGVRNLNDAISMVQTAEGAVATGSEIAQRIMTLATQGATETASATSRLAIKTEMLQLLSAINGISDRTNFGGLALLDEANTADSTSKFDIQVSNTSGDVIGLRKDGFMDIGASNPTYAAITYASASGTVYSLSNGQYTAHQFTTGATGAAKIDGVTQANNTIASYFSITSGSNGQADDLSTAINARDSTAPDADEFNDVLDAAVIFIARMDEQRSVLGATQNELEYAVSNVTELSANTISARSRVIDTDYASETANLTKGQILQQAATAMLAQANQMPNVILSLLK